MIHTIELVDLKNTKEILDIYAPYIKNTPITFEYEVPTMDEFRARINNIINYFPWLVYKIDNVIVGYAYASSYKERAAFQWDAEVSVYLLPSYYGHGIASALYHTLLELLTLQGFYNAYALICVPNDKSINLHHALGFQMIGIAKQTGYKFNKWHDLATLVKSLKSFEIEPVATTSITNIDKYLLDNILNLYLPH